jgi:hypothetical protein
VPATPVSLAARFPSRAPVTPVVIGLAKSNRSTSIQVPSFIDVADRL